MNGAIDSLYRSDWGKIVALNRAAAVAMVNCPQAGLALMDAPAAKLDGYHLLHAARADLLHRAGSCRSGCANFSQPQTKNRAVAFDLLIGRLRSAHATALPVRGVRA